ncbi:hypothetical protein DITRI_Ditri06bG0101900 [Diplodiscus trichospermus]
MLHSVQTIAPVPQLYACESADDPLSSSLRKEHYILKQFMASPSALVLTSAFNVIKERGTPIYMSPESVIGEVTGALDV